MFVLVAKKMKKDKFDELWNNIVLPIYDDANVDGILYLKRNAKKDVYKQYQKEKTYVKRNYMLSGDTHLDRHKIASCMLYAIMKVYPVQLSMKAIWKMHKQKGKFSKEYELLNEYLALYTAFSIIESFRQYGISHNDEDYPAKGFVRNRINMPDTSNGQDYLYNTCLDLYFSKQRRKINVLTFSNVFFLLELHQQNSEMEQE